MKKKQLRSNFEPGSTRWAGRRAQWRALGLTDEDMEKPKIAVVNTSSELSICFSHVDGIAKVVKDAVRAAGGLPFEIRTMAVSDFITSAGRAGTFLLPSRDLITNDIEVQVEGAQLDGMVLLSSCDKTPPGHLMAAARMNIPSISVLCGYQKAGEYKGHHVDIEDVFLGAGHHLAGALSFEDLKGMADNAIQSPGVCAGMGTANSMHSVVEALGMALPGGAPVEANSPKMFDYAKRAGQRIVDMVWEDLKPRNILTKGAFINASAVVLAVSGSINCIKHLQAIAMEAGTDVDVYNLFETLADRIPILSAVMPIGKHTIEQFEAAGGALGVMKQLEPLLETAALTVTGKTVAENLAGVTVGDPEVIRPLDRPFATKPGIVILRGNLAPDGAIVKIGLRGEGRPLQFRGPAKVYEDSAEAEAALKKGEIKRGDAVVLRGQGIHGGPGMGGASRLVFQIDGAGLGPDVAVITDGQLSGLVNKGLVLGEVAPESATGGPLALVQNGDSIFVDVEKKVATLEVPEAELAARAARLKPFAIKHDSGWLSIYERTVRPLHEGAVLLRDKQ
ncbi:MAG: dihydroxy-acid dehydratase [Bradyrhizobiaceae bacterium]|nr:dihydroxy-acid dehydratase [Bradyrhizobiaceae bacterium]